MYDNNLLLKFDSIIGHDKLKLRVVIAYEAAVKNNTSMPHMLFYGNPGCGKTSTVRSLVQHTNLPMIEISSNKIRDFNDVFQLMTHCNKEGYDRYGNIIDKINPTLIFIDEIHRLPEISQEYMGISMEEFSLPTGNINTVYWIPKFTLVGATTNESLLTKPFIDRIPNKFIFSTYNTKDMVNIVLINLNKINILYDKNIAINIAKRCRGTPRLAINFIRDLKNFCTATDIETINNAVVNDLFDIIQIDEFGFTITDLNYLNTLRDLNGLASIETLSRVLGLTKNILTVDIEPYLMKQQVIEINSKGRNLTFKGRLHIGGGNSLGIKEIV